MGLGGCGFLSCSYSLPPGVSGTNSPRISPRSPHSSSPNAGFIASGSNSPRSPHGPPLSPRSTGVFTADPYPVSPRQMESPRGRYMRSTTPPVIFVPPELLPDYDIPSPTSIQFVEENPSIKFKSRDGYCTWCGITSSPEWRPGPTGKKTLCNACGLKFSRTLGSNNSPVSLQM